MARVRGEVAARVPGPRRAALVTLGALDVVGCVGGCDWRDFDDIKAHTPVLSAGAPASYGAADDFGRYVLALSGPATGATGGRFVGSAASVASLGVVAIDARGEAASQNVTSDVFLTGAVNGQSLPITSLADVPAAIEVLLGAPQAGDTGSVYVLTPGPTPAVRLFGAPVGAAGFGLGVAAGQWAGGGAPDLVVVTQDELDVFIDGDASQMAAATPPGPDCPLALAGDVSMVDRNNRAVLVAPLTGAATSQIVVGTVASGGNEGAVSVFDVDATTGAATCVFAYRNAAPLFGHALATGDFDADGAPDLLIGAPPTGAFWVRGPLTATSAVLPVTLTGAGGGQLGASVAALDVDGQPGDEAIVVSDPAATVAGQMLDGRGAHRRRRRRSATSCRRSATTTRATARPSAPPSRRCRSARRAAERPPP